MFEHHWNAYKYEQNFDAHAGGEELWRVKFRNVICAIWQPDSEFFDGVWQRASASGLASHWDTPFGR